MIVKTFVQQIAERLPTNHIVSFHQAIAAVEAIFGRSVSAEHNTLMRRHLNLLAMLREKRVLAVGNERDQWAVEVPAVRRMSTDTKYIDVPTIDGMLRYERIETPRQMSEEQIKEVVARLNSELSVVCTTIDYEYGGFTIDGHLKADSLAVLLQLARAAQP